MTFVDTPALVDAALAEAPASALDSLRQHGRNSFSSCLLYDGVEHYRCTRTDGFIGYLPMPAMLVAVGEPVCPPSDYRIAADEFIEFAAARRCSVTFVAVGDQFVEAMRDHHATLLVLGEDLLFDVQRYAPRGDGAKKVRSAVNQLARRPSRVREYRPAEARDEPLERALVQVAANWLGSRSRFQMHFLSLDLFRLIDVKRYFYLEVDGRPVAFLCCLPIFARRGYLFEDLVREPGAPRGASETLVLEALRTFRAEGAAMATFGLSPRLGLNGSSNLSWFGRGMVLTAFAAATRLSRLDRLYHSRKKFHTGIAESSYLLKYPPGIRAREVAGVLRAFHLS
jgi:phosphatidylglycerol lysyltransferase